MSIIDWLYLPRPRSRLKRLRVLRSRASGGTRLYQRRVHNRNEHNRLFRAVFGLFMIIFALRVGSEATFSMQHPVGFNAIMYSHGVHLPKLGSSRRFYNSRSFVIIRVTKDGVATFDGERIDPKVWRQFLVRYRSGIPKLRAFLVIDRDSRMGVVQDLLSAVRDAGIRYVVFAASIRDDTFL